MAESFIAHSRCVFHYLLYISYARFVYNWYGRSRVDKYSRFRVLVCVFYPNQRIVLFAFFKVWKRGVNVAQIEWIRCPVCGNKTRDRIREDTVLINYPLYCPKCRKESLIQVKQLQIKVIKEPGALDAEPMNLWAITVCRLCSYIATDRTSPPNKKNGVLVGCFSMLCFPSDFVFWSLEGFSLRWYDAVTLLLILSSTIYICLLYTSPSPRD